LSLWQDNLLTGLPAPQMEELTLDVPAVLCVLAQILPKFQQKIIFIIKTIVQF
jgi:hypothetical protein